MKAKELITKVLVGNPKTIVSIFAVMLLICGIQGIGYAAPTFSDADGVIRSVPENQANANVGAILVVTVDAGITLNDSHYDFGDAGNFDFASFSLRAVEGGVRLVTRNALDYEKQTDYEVIIRVRDNIANNGGSARAIDDEITVIIMVTNVSVTDGDTEVANKEPVFTEGTSTTRVVNENTAPKEDIGTAAPVAATDVDDTGATLTYGLLRGADAASFDIDSMTGQLKTKAALDYETKDTYMVTVTVTDGKDAEDNVNPAVDDTIRVTITVMDVNDAPAFATKTATRSVAENTVPDANIGDPVVVMDDPDGDTSTYMLDGTHEESFDIDEDTGQLRTKAPLNYETQTDYEVMVIATDDHSGDVRTGTITVTINVRNVSVTNGDTEVANSAPAFNDGPSTTREVDENTAVKANIGAPVAAKDVDRGDTLTYGLLSDANDDAASFDIDAETGQLKTKVALDHENEDTYMVTVTVTDGKDVEGSVDTAVDVDDRITVTITVTDVNDAPAFADATRTVFPVPENTVANANIGAEPVDAMDVDGDTLTYTLGGTHAASFGIVGDSGQLQTKAALDYETQTDYEVMVIATDDGVPPLTGTITVTINVTNVQGDDTEVANSAPAFGDGPSTTRIVDENIPKADIGTDDGTDAPVAATDRETDTLTYGLRGADAASFDIESTTGQLKTKVALDHETKDTYMVTVTVTDGRDAEKNVDPAVDDTITVTIMVTDVDEAPVFPDTIAPIVVDEGTVPEANIGNPVVATDVDSGDKLTYTLENPDASFAIDEDTGQLQTKDPLDYETQTDYEVMVIATDNGDDGTDPLSDTITVTINVRNVSVTNGDTAVANSEPVFTEGPSTTREVAENTAVKANIGAPVAAKDVDRGDTLTYGLSDADADARSFDIDEDTGQLKINAELVPLFDFEGDPAKTSYMVTVTVKDGKDEDGNVDVGGAEVDDTIRVTIMVTNVNEAPVFPDTIPIVVAEDTAAGVDIGAPVVAMDEDDGDTLTYTLGGTDAASFDIVGDSGQLQTKAALDFETQTDYEVMVIATDKAGLTGEITVTINVRNVEADDTEVANKEPAFTDGPSTTHSVPENTPKGMNINASGNPTEADPVVATDADDEAGDTLTYGLRGADAASFDIESTTGQLKTKAALDHETKDTYMVTVTVTDGKDAADNFALAVDDTIRVTITVMDVNEAPVFPDTIAPIVVAENTVTGTNIGNPVVATDVDSGDKLRYTLGGTDASFAIDPATGQLQTKDPLDYETQTDYEVMVIATDNGDDGTDPLSDTITVTINVRNVSVTNGDTAVANSEPVFTEGPSTTREVAENTAVKANIGAPVAAKDVDRGDTLTYGLSGADADARSFDIDEDTGQLKINAELVPLFDFEGDPAKTSYMVTVTVTDGKDEDGNVDVGGAEVDDDNHGHYHGHGRK